MVSAVCVATLAQYGLGTRNPVEGATVRRYVCIAMSLIALAVAGGCTSSSPNSQSHPYTEFSKPGPYTAGTSQFDVGGDPVVVWYPVSKMASAGHAKYAYHLRAWVPASIAALVPASFNDRVDEDAYESLPMANGRFPIVLFSHGYGGYPEQSSFLTAHLATWGMIVVAPDQRMRDVTAVILGQSHPTDAVDVEEQLAALAYIARQGHTERSLFFDHVDDGDVATLGHSAGGGTAVSVAAADPSVRGWIAMAGVPVPLPSKPVPSLMISGSADKAVPTSIVGNFYSSVTGNKRLVVINGYGHNVFDDVCTVNHAKGGLTNAIQALHLAVPPGIAQLATDGCEPPDAYPPTAWPLIDQVVTAQLLYDFGGRSRPVGLGPPLTTSFPGVHLRYSAVA
jgi:dienelactone hydrolase